MESTGDGVERIVGVMTTGGRAARLNNNSFQPGVPAASPATPNRKRGNACVLWGCIGTLFALCAGAVVATGVGYYLYSSNTGLQNMVLDLGIAPTPLPQLDASGKPIGPMILDTKDTGLNSRFSNSFRHYTEYSMDGYDDNDAPVATAFILEVMQQDQPEWSSYKYQVKKKNAATVDESEGVVLKGMSYDVQHDGTCRAQSDSFAGQRQLENWPGQSQVGGITGSLRRAETGVTINDVLTDRYEVTLQNMASGRSTIAEWKSGSLYRAREGGYVVRLEYSMAVKPQGWGMNSGSEYSTVRPAVLTFRDDLTYFPNGTLKVKVPAACASQVPAN